jgi:predicted transcriptional regulator
MATGEELSVRERQIMEALYRIGKASAAEVQQAIPQPPTYTAVRTHLTNLHQKGHVTYTSDGTRFIYEPVVPREEMAQTVVSGVLQTFFDNSVEKIVATLVNKKESRVSPEELDRLTEIIEQARRGGR